MIVAIDGPAGAGKSTTARRVAQELGFAYVDTGAMYRAVALTASEAGLDVSSGSAGLESELAALAGAMPLHFAAGGTRLYLGGRDVSTAIRTPEIAALASRIAAFPAVRVVVVERQRELANLAEAECGGAVLEGRDIQTVVFPDARVKIFLTASPEVRARRRLEQWQGAPGQVSAGNAPAPDLSAAEKDVRERDARDSGREASPLLAAHDAVHVSTDDLDTDAVVASIVALARSRA